MSETPSHYAPGSEEEVVVPPTDGAEEARRRDWEDPAHTDLDPDEIRDGGAQRMNDQLARERPTGG